MLILAGTRERARKYADRKGIKAKEWRFVADHAALLTADPQTEVVVLRPILASNTKDYERQKALEEHALFKFDIDYEWDA